MKKIDHFQEWVDKLYQRPECQIYKLEETILDHIWMNFLDATVHAYTGECKELAKQLLSFPQINSKPYLLEKSKEIATLPPSQSFESSWSSLFSIKKQWMESLKKQVPHATPPLIPLYFKGEIQNVLRQIQTLEVEEIPVFLFEPFDWDWQKILGSLENRPTLFLFPTLNHLGHALSHPAVLEHLKKGIHSALVLNLYPATQKESQPELNKSLKKMKWISLDEKSPLQQTYSLWWNHLQEYLSGNALKGDPLYQKGKETEYLWSAHRLGPKRYFAVDRSYVLKQWYDSHKSEQEGTVITDYRTQYLNRLRSQSTQRSIKRNPPFKLAHVVPQIVDGGHAPSIILENLIEYHSPAQFDVSIYSSERLFPRRFEYPRSPYISQHSSNRGRQRIANFQLKGIPVLIETGNNGFWEQIEMFKLSFKQQQLDFVVFHGPSMIHSIPAKLCDVPIKILFDHGNLPSYQTYDALIVSSEDQATSYKEQYGKENGEVYHLPYAIDARKDWEKEPYENHFFDLPENAQLLTTISGKLEARLSEAMCHAISEILHRSPHAYYCPIGAIANPQSLMERFSTDIRSRIRFLGELSNPSQYTRSMTLYLNEFPFGSGIAILEAMAAGCPIVTMYDEKGEAQARFGGLYMGKDFAVTSGNTQKYIELACRLLQDSNFHATWSEKASVRYEKHSDIKQYVARFEEIMLAQLLTTHV